MSVYGIGNSNIPRTPAQLPVRDGTRPPVQQPAVPVVVPTAKPAAPATAKGTQSVPVEAP